MFNEEEEEGNLHREGRVDCCTKAITIELDWIWIFAKDATPRIITLIFSFMILDLLWGSFDQYEYESLLLLILNTTFCGNSTQMRLFIISSLFFNCTSKTTRS